MDYLYGKLNKTVKIVDSKIIYIPGEFNEVDILNLYDTKEDGIYRIDSGLYGAELIIINKEYSLFRRINGEGDYSYDFINHEWIGLEGDISSISIDGVDQPIIDKNVDLPAYPTKTSLGLGDVVNKPMDSEVTEDSENYISSGAVKTYVDANGGAINSISVNNINQPIINKNINLNVFPIDINEQYIRITDLESGIYRLKFNGTIYIYYNGYSSTDSYIVGDTQTLQVIEPILTVIKIYNRDKECDYWYWYLQANEFVKGFIDGDTNNGSYEVDNVFTNAEQTKLVGIEAGAQVNAANTVIDANYVHTDNNFTDSYKNEIGVLSLPVTDILTNEEIIAFQEFLSLPFTAGGSMELKSDIAFNDYKDKEYIKLILGNPIGNVPAALTLKKMFLFVIGMDDETPLYAASYACTLAPWRGDNNTALVNIALTTDNSTHAPLTHLVISGVQPNVIEGKQDTLTEGSNISINDNVISAANNNQTVFAKDGNNQDVTFGVDAAVRVKAGSNVSVVANANDGEITISATDTTYSAVSDGSGSSGLLKRNTDTTVSAQSQSTKFLREDGKWVAPSYTTDHNQTVKVGNETFEADESVNITGLDYIVTSANSNNNSIAIGMTSSTGVSTNAPKGDVLTADGIGGVVWDAPQKIRYSTTAPSEANTDGGLKFIVLTSEPQTKYNGYIYFITSNQNNN